MADVLAMSENAATLAKQIGDRLQAQGSTAEIKSMGSRIAETASSLQQEVQRRRVTRKAPAKSILPAGLSAMNTLIAQEKAKARKAVESAIPSKGIFGRTMAALRGTKPKEQPEQQEEKPMSVANAFKNQPLFTGGARRRTRRHR